LIFRYQITYLEIIADSWVFENYNCVVNIVD